MAHEIKYKKAKKEALTAKEKLVELLERLAEKLK